MQLPNRLTPSQQCYLAEIMTLESQYGQARQSEIAQRLQVNKSSVTAALKVLARHGLIEYEPFGPVWLTPEGRIQADIVLERWRLMREFLMKTLNLEEDLANEAACRMCKSAPQHVMDLIAVKLKDGRSLECRRNGVCE